LIFYKIYLDFYKIDAYFQHSFFEINQD